MQTITINNQEYEWIAVYESPRKSIAYGSIIDVHQVTLFPTIKEQKPSGYMLRPIPPKEPVNSKKVK